MVFDPFGLEDYHQRIRERILAQEPGYAQTVISDVMISYEAAAVRGLTFASSLFGDGWPARQAHILDELIIDVAHGEAIASPHTFSRPRIQRMVEEFRGCPDNYVKLRQRAELLNDFYLKKSAIGRLLLF